MGITHEWNGTVLTITSDSGTSSCDLQGEKGDTGVRGPQGVKGNTGEFDPTTLEIMLQESREYTDSEIAETKQIAEHAETIARGKATGYVFDTVAALDEWLAVGVNAASLQQGDNLYIRATDVPDYWWDGESKQQLETQKVDLSEYATKDDLANTETKITDLTTDINDLTTDINDLATSLGVEQGGASGSWRYRKYNDGYAEAWGEVTGSGKAVGINTTLVEFPFYFVDGEYIVNFTPARNATQVTWYGACNGAGNKQQGSGYTYFSYKLSSEHIPTFNFHVVGRWK